MKQELMQEFLKKENIIAVVGASRDPEKYGYKLIFKRLKDYYAAMNLPHWSLWISYETENFSRLEISKIILDFWEALANIKWKLGLITRGKKELETFIVNFERAALQDVMNVASRSLTELEQLAAEIIEISKDRVLSLNYILTHNLEDERIISLSSDPE